jgi:phospholipid/cholesterol/gamma-HCH transport system ATP-binding protein
MIEIKNLNKSFGNKPILKDISVVFERGKANLIIGQSGSGKTVLLKCIVGLHNADSGEIIYDGIIFNKLNSKEKREIRRQIGMLFQGGALFDSNTVEENIMFPLDMFTDMGLEEKKERVDFCLKRVTLINVNKLYPAELSGGMQKRVAIARAIALKPRYLFCDEPNSGLDPKSSIVIDNLIKEITEELNITTIVNTHDMNSVMEIGQKVVFIYEGEKAWEGSNKDILESDNKLLNDFVFATNLTRRLKKV